MKYVSEYWEDVQHIIQKIPGIETLYGKKIIITGATGMVCSSVVDVLSLLNKRYDANIHLCLAGRSAEKVLRRFRGVLNIEDYKFIEFDATKNLTVFETADYFIHGASNANPAVYSKQPVETLMGNILGLRSILEAARLNPKARVLYISSSEVYGNRINDFGKPYQENDYGYVDILNPRACYPNGKRAAETLCISYGQEYDVDTVMVRPGHIYGPSITETDTRASAAFTRDVIEGHDIVMKSSGQQMRSYCYTLDCAAAILTVLIKGKKGNAYNISNRDSVVSIRDIAEAFAKEGGVKVVYENPSDIEKKSYNLMNNSVLDALKLETLGWNPLFGLEYGVRQTIKCGGKGDE